jgi:hypothetical protein
MNDDSEARRLALALARLREAGDQAGMRLLLDDLDSGQLRAVLTAQTENVSVLLEGLFVPIEPSHLPGVAARFGRTRHEVVDDHLGQLIYRLAGAKQHRDDQ